MLRFSIGYPSTEMEAEILASHTSGEPLAEIGPSRRPGRGRDDRTGARGARRAGDPSYIVDVGEATRRHGDIYLGASLVRASLRSCRSCHGRRRKRDFVVPDDVKALATPALAHRIIVTADSVMSGRTAEVVLGETLSEVAVPVAEGP